MKRICGVFNYPAGTPQAGQVTLMDDLNHLQHSSLYTADGSFDFRYLRDGGEWSLLFDPDDSNLSPFVSNNITATGDIDITYRDLVMAQSPDRFYQMNDTTGTVIKDIAGGQDGTFTNIVKGNQGLIPHDPNTSIGFGSNSSSITIPDITPGTAFSFSCLFSSTNTGLNKSLFGGTASGHLWFKFVSTDLQLIANITTVRDTAIGVLTAGATHFLQVTVDSGYYEVYIDSAMVMFGTVADTWSFRSLGAGGHYDMYPVRGDMQAFAYWDRVLTTTELEDQYRASKGFLKNSYDALLFEKGGLLTYYRMNEDSLNDRDPHITWEGATHLGENPLVPSSLGTSAGFQMDCKLKDSSPPLSAKSVVMVFRHEDSLEQHLLTFYQTFSRFFQLKAHSNGAFRVYWNTGSSNYLTTSAGLIQLNAIHHLVYQFNGTAGELYLDGVRVWVNAQTDNPFAQAAGTPLYIGGYHNTASRFNGKIDDVALFDRHFTQAEITEMSNRSKI